jgi:hypothetical protein
MGPTVDALSGHIASLGRSGMNRWWDYQANATKFVTVSLAPSGRGDPGGEWPHAETQKHRRVRELLEAAVRVLSGPEQD